MSEKTEKRRAALRERLLDAAEIRIAREGLHTLRARDLAGDAECSLGAIYNVFDDLTGLIMAVNGRTFLRIGEQVGAVADPSLPPDEHLIRLSDAYLNFARNNTGAWRALFDLDTGQGDEVPDWYVAALNDLFARINQPVSQLFPNDTDEEIALMSRTLFSAVHGIISLGLENRISAVPESQIEQMIRKLLESIAGKK